MRKYVSVWVLPTAELTLRRMAVSQPLQQNRLEGKGENRLGNADLEELRVALQHFGRHRPRLWRGKRDIHPAFGGT